MPLKSNKELSNLPVHVGVIMDGNGRWAKKRGMPRTFGHKEGAKTFRKITKHAKAIGIKYITFYAFSTENWKRPKQEVDTIMNLFDEYLDEVRNHVKENVRVLFIGDKSRLSEKLQSKMIALENDSKDMTAMTLILAFNYGGRDEIVHSVKKISQLAIEGFIKPEQIDEALINSNLYTAGIPDADLIIRPSGEMRTSNFLIWQSAYSELYFSDILWPDFTTKDFDKALETYSKRSRRFGGI